LKIVDQFELAGIKILNSLEIFISQIWDMPEWLTGVWFGLITYPILVAQLGSGFPPLYDPVLENTDLTNIRVLLILNLDAVFCVILVAFLIAATGARGPMLLVGLSAIVVGRRIRKQVFRAGPHNQ
jgi:hypothetical protein